MFQDEKLIVRPDEENDSAMLIIQKAQVLRANHMKTKSVPNYTYIAPKQNHGANRTLFHKAAFQTKIKSKKHSIVNNTYIEKQ